MKIVHGDYLTQPDVAVIGVSVADDHNLVVDLITRKDFGCILHEEIK